MIIIKLRDIHSFIDGKESMNYEWMLNVEEKITHVVWSEESCCQERR